MKHTNAFLFVTHKVNEEILERYTALESETKDIGHTFFLLNEESDCYEEKIPQSNITPYIFNEETLNELDYEPIADTIIPGSNHFATLQFFKDNPGFTFYWVIEYDVIYTGNWNNFFENFENIEVDFISSKIQRYEDVPFWPWWKSLHLDDRNLKAHQLLMSFNPIYRISNKALAFLDRFLKGRKNWGHHEALIPTALGRAGFKLLDFGGNGEFVLPQFRERFYIDQPNLNIRTMRYRPFIKQSELVLQDKLYHPVKTSEEKDSSLQSMFELPLVSSDYKLDALLHRICNPRPSNKEFIVFK